MIKNIFKYLSVLASACILFGCQSDNLIKPSALMTESSLTFASTGGESQLLRIVSDDVWYVDVTEDWINVSTASGSLTEEISVSVEDNVLADGKTVNVPRQGEVVIANKRGYTVTCVIYQNGDSYLGSPELSLSEAVKLEDGSFAKISGAQVVAATAEGFVAAEGSTSVYVLSSAKVEIGDNVFIGAEKVTTYGLPSLKAGEVDVLSNSDPVRPTPVDLISNLSLDNAGSVVYVSTTAGLLSNVLYFDTAVSVSVKVLNTSSTSGIDLDAVNMHNVAMEAYYVGIDGSTVCLALAKAEDQGVNSSLDAYFYDDFSWMKSFIDASGVQVDDSVADNNASGSAPNLRTNSALALLLDEFLARGYQDLNQSAKVIYPQSCYWKFGKTSYNGGIILPSIEFKGSELVNAVIDFDWAAHMTGTGNIDDVQVVVEVSEDGGLFENGTNISDPLYTTQTKGHLEWQHASILLKGASNKTVITVRPLNYESATPDQQRWYIDNIKIADSGVPYSDPVYATVTVSDEVLTFEGIPTGASSFTVKSDNDWTIAKGNNSDWFTVDVLEGKAGEEVKVTVNCESNPESTMRHGTMVISSADTRKNIHVVQSTAGGDLEPFISIVGGNSVAVAGKGGDVAVTIQSNVEFNVETSDSWIVKSETAAASALVEKTACNFNIAGNTGDARNGTIRFYNETYGIESILNVSQEKFEPRVEISASGIYLGVSGLGGSVNFSVDANIDFDIATEADWIKLPASKGVEGTYSIPVAFVANTSDQSRSAVVKITNETYGISNELTVSQFPKGIVFYDNFDWMAPMVAALKESSPGDYDTVGNKNINALAPNIYTTASLKSFFVPIRDAIGYIIPGKDDGAYNVVYVQENYLKLGKTSSSSQTSLTLPAVDADGKDYTVSMNWARMVQASGTVDNYTLTFMITGNGTFENGTKYSDAFSTPQAAGEIFWTNISAVVKGADKDTRITVVATDLLNTSTGAIDYTKSGARRIFVDDIKIAVE